MEYQRNEKYLKNVADYQPVLLPKPRKKAMKIVTFDSGEDPDLINDE